MGCIFPIVWKLGKMLNVVSHDKKDDMATFIDEQ